MKITVIPLVLAAVICFSGSVLAIRYRYAQNDFRLPDDVHILAIGNSQLMQALNDRILTGWRNIGYASQYYMEEVVSLDNFLSANAQIDTVVVGVSLASFIKFKDEDFTSRAYSWAIHNSVSDVVDDSLLCKSLSSPNFYTALMTTCLQNCVGGCKAWGEYSNEDIYLLDEDIDNYKTVIAEMGGPGITSEAIVRSHQMQIEGLRRLIGVCDKHDVVLVLMVLPMYGFDTLVDNPDVFKEVIQQLGDSIHVSDYENFQFPDTFRYKDVVHIDIQSSNYFSQYIKAHGMQCVYMKDYIK